MNKNDCNVVRDLMPLVLDRVASDESREIVEEHITACGECCDGCGKHREGTGRIKYWSYRDDRGVSS